MKLENKRLQVRFAEPEQLRTQRFDHTAVVKQVLLDGVHTFCTPEQLLPGRRSCHGIGLCGEFVLDGAAEKAKAGEWFCKPGVGALKQTGDQLPYDMWHAYEMRPFPITVQHSEQKILFRQKAIPCGGYGVDIEKTFRLEGGSLILDISVRNAGTEACCLREYQHNFVCLGGAAVSEGYVLDLPCDRDLAGMESETLRQGDEIRLPSAVRVSGGSVYWERDLENRILYHRSERVHPEHPWQWKLHHLRTGISVAEQTDFCPVRIDVWAVEHCVCPEFYHEVTLTPGEMARWQRRWTFDADY